MKRSFIFIALCICFSAAFSQKQLPVIRNHNAFGPLKTDSDAGIIHPVNLSVQEQPYDSLVTYSFNSAIDSVYKWKRIYSYDNKSRRSDELWLKWNIENHTWRNFVKFHYAYDDADRLIFESDYSYTDGKWIGFFKEEKTFDENGKQVFYIFSQDWDSTLNEFIPMEKNETTYEGDNVSTFTSYTWMEDVNGGDWVKSYHSEHFYNEQGGFVLHISSRWSEESNSWENESKDTATYDDQGFQTMSEHYFWVSDAWVPYTRNFNVYNGLSSVRTTYNYASETSEWLMDQKIEYLKDENDNVLSSIEYSWDHVSSGWIAKSEYDYTYDEHQNMTSEVDAEWNGILHSWDMLTKWARSYDDQSRETLYAQFEWDAAVSDWKETYRNENTFDVSGNLVEKITLNFKEAYGFRVISYFDKNGNIKSDAQYSGDYDNWTITYKSYYYLTAQSPLGVSAIDGGSFGIYPNPAADVIRISGIQGQANLIVYDLQGNKVVQSRVGSDQPVSLAGLSKGMYVVKVETADGVVERKIVKN